MNDHSPLSVMERFWTHLAKANASGGVDWDDALALMHPDVRIVEPDSLPYGGVTYGPAAYRKLVTDIAALWSPAGSFTRDAFTSENAVVYRSRGKARAIGTNREFEVQTMTQWSVKDGLITEVYHFYFDVCAVREALGMTSCPTDFG